MSGTANAWECHHCRQPITGRGVFNMLDQLGYHVCCAPIRGTSEPAPVVTDAPANPRLKRRNWLTQREADALGVIHSHIGEADRICLDRALRDYRDAVKARVMHDVWNAPR